MTIERNFIELVRTISSQATDDYDFKNASTQLENFVENASPQEQLSLVEMIGTIPESIRASSSEEKVFAKAGDTIAASAFKLLGLNSKPLDARGDAGDFFAQSIHQNYSLIGDAKSFRLSRTAKNQKDFKVKALSQWREDNDYAVLVAPFFQYPNKKSQIFAQSLEENVLLFSWEHLAILLKLGAKESNTKTLEQLWNFPQKHSKKVLVADRQKNFFREFNQYFMQEFTISKEQLEELLYEQIEVIAKRADLEKKYWEREVARIKELSHDEAIEELLKQINISSKINKINGYVGGLEGVAKKYLV